MPLLPDVTCYSKDSIPLLSNGKYTEDDFGAVFNG